MSENTQNTIKEQIFEAKISDLEKSITSILDGRKINKIDNVSLLNIVLSSTGTIVHFVKQFTSNSFSMSGFLSTTLEIAQNVVYTFIEVNGDIFLIDASFCKLFEDYKKGIFVIRKTDFFKSIGLE